MESASDEEIARTVQQGDAEAFGELVVRYEGKLRRYARKFLRYKEDIDDVVQDVCIKAYTHIQSFDTSLRFSPWIYRIAHNTFVNELKRQGRYGVSLFDADTILPFLPAKETADAETLSEEEKREVDLLLESLPLKYKEVLILHYFEDLSYEEIAEILKVPRVTVGVRLTRARKKLQELSKMEKI